MTTDGTPMPHSKPPAAPGPAAAPESDADFSFEAPSPGPMPLDLVELELALDLNDVSAHGFSEAVRAAARTVEGEFLFDLPASGLADDAQRIAVVCLSRADGGRFGLVLLSAEGDRVRAAEADASTKGLVDFARAFVGVLEQL
ncbi:hypothetical protein [Hoeflea olei]|uniref:hypothetical protein n=1 Tax=Hoeflea olei TaxID=1480615 RepID=UPI00082529CE|nr:hypothetical protein [Hoeflea olei]